MKRNLFNPKKPMNLLASFGLCSLTFFTALCTNPVQAQSWTSVGTAGFSPGAVSDVSSAMTSSGTPYVFFQDSANGRRGTVMKYNGSSWVLVGNAGFTADEIQAGYGTSIAIDNSGTPYVAYLDLSVSAFHRLTVKKFDGSFWQTVGSAGFSAGSAVFPSLAIDGSTPYVAYQDGGASSKATVMKFNGSSWTAVGTAAFTPGRADFTVLRFYGSTPYVSYEDYANAQKMSVMKYNGSSWVNVGSAGFSAGQANFPQFTIDGSGTPYVIYSDASNAYKAVVMKFNGASWAAVGSSTGISAGQADFPTIVTDNSNTPYAVYRDVANSKKLTAIKFNGSSWVAAGTAGFSAGSVWYISTRAYGASIYTAYQDYANGFKASMMTLFSMTPITGASTVCVGSTTTLNNITSGGVWSSSNAGVATVNSSGLVGGVSAGSVTISYAKSGSTATFPMTVNVCSVLPIIGAHNVCEGATTQLSNMTSGGSWSSTNLSVATISASGMVTGVSAGTTTISYAVTGNAATMTMTVDPCPTAIKNNERAALPVLSIVPNPSHGSFLLNIAAAVNEQANVTITDMTGRKVKEFVVNTNSSKEMVLNVGPGIYFLSAVTGTGTVTARIAIE